jgi:hypothetical protein
LISLFGRTEFDPPGSAWRDPWTVLQVSGFWVLLSLLQIWSSNERVLHLRSSGRSVSVWREAEVWFWGVILLFWLWNGWKSYRKYRAEQKLLN